MRKLLIVLFGCLLASAAAAQNADWQDVLNKARGQTVYFNAWGGDDRNNAFIRWVGERVRQEFGIDLRHVKLSNTAEAVSRVLAEKAAGRLDNGTVDLIWINGENFLTMRQNGLLHGPFADRLPNMRLVDTIGKPTTIVDFTVPTDGFEAPWRMAQIVFPYDGARIEHPPRSIPGLLDWARANPGRFTYPNPRNFLGATFLKQALYELAPDPNVLQQPATDQNFAPVTARLWTYLDRLRPHLWRGGAAHPASGPAQRQLLADGEIDITISFNPAEASLAIANGLLPDSIRTFVMERGTIGNASFVAIPFNASAKEGAMAVANFLLSPAAQAHAQDPRVLGNFTVLDLNKLTPAERKLFYDLPRGVATLSGEELGTPLPEPHPSWMVRLTQEWQRRYGS